MEDKEKYITSYIKNHREELDMDALWADVAPHIPQQKKKRRMGFWILGVMAMIALVVSFSWMADSVNVEKHTIAPSSPLSGSEPMKQTSSNQKTKNIATAEKNSIETRKDNHIEENTFDQSSVILTKKPNSTRRKLLRNEQVENKVASSKKAQSKTTNSEQSKSSVKKNFDKEIIASETTSDLRLTSRDESSSNTEVASLSQVRKKIENFPFLNTKSSLPEYNRAVGTMAVIPIKVKDGQQTRWHNRWNLYALFGGGVADRSLRNRTEELLAERDRRASIVDVLGTWDMELGFGFRLSPRLKVETGLMYTQVHERASFTTDYQMDVEVQSEILINRQDGTTINELSSTTEQKSIRTTETRYNQWRTLQIPFRVSYQLVNIDKFRLGIGGLFSYGIWQEFKGFTSFSTAQESYDLQQDQEGRFRSHGAVSYGVSLLASRHLTSMLDLNLGLGFRQQRNINSEIYLIDQQYNFFIINCGISRRF